MEGPVFRLEGVVKSRNEMADFEGPLTLILQLLSKDKIEIKDISISLILDQYLARLDKMAELDLDVASEFVAMASHLAYIKTKMLLADSAEITELEQLISSLEELRRGDIYVQIKAAAMLLSGQYQNGGAMMVKPPEYLPVDGEYKYEHDRTDLLDAVMRLIGREDAKKESINKRETVYPHRIIYSVSEKMSEILNRLRQFGVTPVSALFTESRSRTEIVATLIAVLELCKLGGVMLTGADDDLSISYAGGDGDIIPEDYDFTAE